MVNLQMLLLRFITIVILILGIQSCNRADTYDIYGNGIHLKDYKGKWIIVNYWASWCKPCLTEMPELNELYLKHKKQMVIFGVNYDQLSSSEIETFAKKLNIQFPLLRSFPIERFGVKNISTLPFTLLISPESNSITLLQGPQTQATFEKEIGLSS